MRSFSDRYVRTTLDPLDEAEAALLDAMTSRPAALRARLRSVDEGRDRQRHAVGARDGIQRITSLMLSLYHRQARRESPLTAHFRFASNISPMRWG